MPIGGEARFHWIGDRFGLPHLPSVDAGSAVAAQRLSLNPVTVSGAAVEKTKWQPSTGGPLRRAAFQGMPFNARMHAMALSWAQHASGAPLSLALFYVLKAWMYLFIFARFAAAPPELVSYCIADLIYLYLGSLTVSRNRGTLKPSSASSSTTSYSRVLGSVAARAL
jgi:hypothetical protein